MHTTILRLRASVWVALCLIAVVNVHIGATYSATALNQGTAVSTSNSTLTAKAVRTHERVAPAHLGHLRQPGHTFDLAIASDSAHPGPARCVCADTSADITIRIAQVDSTNCERAPPTV
jgi:hypothetical protein